nr:biotin-dependent carboxyltransferase family protein [Solihabitans fulvus]
MEVLASGMLATVQDAGRPGLAEMGVGSSGAADRPALALANRLVGNLDSHAGIEVTFGGLAVRAGTALLVAVTGAPCPITVHGRPEPTNTLLRLAEGEELRLGTPARGLRSYLAVRGGIAVAPVLGARATDTLAGTGPPVLRAGDVLPVGPSVGTLPGIDFAPVAPPPSGDLRLRVLLGPRDDWFTAAAVKRLLTEPYEVTAEIDRVGMRLAGPPLERARTGELPSEGMVRGALQVPPSGQPTLFLADHPLTGGYPVIAVLADRDIDRAAQARPGQRLRFTL